MKHVLLCCAIILFVIMGNSKTFGQQKNDAPLRLAVARATHGHVPWILKRKDKTDVTLVGIYEPNTELVNKLVKTYGLDRSLFYNNLENMLNAVKPTAVVAFGAINEHLMVVEACAPKGIHVMVEKPLATTYEDAKKMEQLAKKNNIFLLTNFETSWYASTEKTYRLVNDNFVGPICKVVIHDGHNGPKEIGVSPEFFEWLTDPVKNGGGALIDFGCYGANLMTFLMKGEEPLSVSAITQQFKPAIYPKVDDDATIIVTYPSAVAVIQASWNWPFSRKDMEVYGETGTIFADNSTNMRLRNHQNPEEKSIKVTTQEMDVYPDPFAYLADVVKGKIQVPANGLYSLQTNMTVVKILDAARQSAKSGKVVLLKNYK